MSTDRKPTRNVTAADLKLDTYAEIMGKLDRIEVSFVVGFVELRQQRNELVTALERIQNKIDIANIDRTGRWAIQTLDAIDEIAQQAIAKAKGSR